MRKPLSLLALYEGYVTMYRGWERRGTIPRKRLRQVERHHVQVRRFLEQQQTVTLAAGDCSFDQATRFLTWLTGPQHYPHERAVRHVRRLQRVLWWGVERAYLVHNPLAGFRCQPVSGSPAQRERKVDTAKLTQVVQTLERAYSMPKS